MLASSKTATVNVFFERHNLSILSLFTINPLKRTDELALANRLRGYVGFKSFARLSQTFHLKSSILDFFLLGL